MLNKLMDDIEATLADTPVPPLAEIEAAYAQAILRHTGGHKGNAVDTLDISRPRLDRKIKSYGLAVAPQHQRRNYAVDRRIARN